MSEAPWTPPQSGTLKEPIECIEPSSDELKNGWDPETLTAYVHAQRHAQSARLDFQSRPRPRPQAQNNGFKFGGRLVQPSWLR